MGNRIYNNSPSQLINTPVHVEYQILKHVVTSASEAETGTVFHNCKTVIGIKKMRHSVGQPQGTTPLKIDNSTAVSNKYATLKEKRSKTWYMRWYYLQDKVKNKEFDIFWKQGSNNKADYHTKHFPPSYHTTVQPTYILKGYHLQII